MRRPPPERLVLLGHPVAHSRSPQMHNAALAAGRHPRTLRGARRRAGALRLDGPRSGARRARRGT